MPTTEERLSALERAVQKLAANKMDTTNFTSINDINISRYIDLHTAYVNMAADITAIKSFITNQLTGNSA